MSSESCVHHPHTLLLAPRTHEPTSLSLEVQSGPLRVFCRARVLARQEKYFGSKTTPFTFDILGPLTSLDLVLSIFSEDQEKVKTNRSFSTMVQFREDGNTDEQSDALALASAFQAASVSYQERGTSGLLSERHCHRRVGLCGCSFC